jgi:glucosamine--fructose-6-phosphate aminotransferase (isomerizing)
VLAISQSGETADTLAAGREAKSRGSKLVAICNVICPRVGPEIGVALAKSVTVE